MRKIGIFTTVCPFPMDVGKNVIWGAVFNYLRSRPDIQVNVYSFMPFPSDFPDPVTLLDRPSFREIFSNLIWLVVVRKQMSIQEAFFFSQKSKDRLLDSLGKDELDILLCDTIRTQQYLGQSSGVRSKVYTYLDDLFSVRYERILAAADGGFGADKYVLGNFAARLPRPARWLFESNAWLRRAILKFEMNAVARSEERACKSSDLSLLISPSEVDVARKRWPDCRVEEIPPRMASTNSRKRNWNGQADFVFLGSLKLAHNITAMEWFLEKCLPIVLPQSPDVVIKIIGAGSSDKLDELRKRYSSNVQKLGFVDSVDDYLLSASCLICPLLFGSGIKIKVIDALRCGLPIISSSVGAEGIHGVEQGAIKLADGAHQFAAAMITMLDLSANRKASDAALGIFEARYSDASTNSRYAQIFDSI